MPLGMSKKLPLAFLAAAVLNIVFPARPAAEPETQVRLGYPLLLQHPTVNQRDIVFSFAGDLWLVARAGGRARNLTKGAGIASAPAFSPDGTKLAFTWQIGGNQDVYVMEVYKDDSHPKRLTFHPGPDTVLGWTRDSRRVLFCAPRSYWFNFQELFTVSIGGGAETKLPLPMGSYAAYSPDGSQLAYVPTEPKVGYFKRYRGGRTTPIWIARLSDSKTTQIPHGNFTDFNPIWVGDAVYFLSDRSGPVTLFAYESKSGQVTKCLENDGFDLKAASYGAGAIVYEQPGSIYLFDVATKKTSRVNIEIVGTFPELAPRNVNVQSEVKKGRLSTTGKVALEARGEIVVFDTTTLKAQNLTSSPGVMDRDPAWSPDGTKVAYFSDESGEYALHIRSASGQGSTDKIQLSASPTFFDSPGWSPDGSKIAFRDKNLSLWFMDIRERRLVLVTKASHSSYAWAPDSGALAYSRRLENQLWALFLYRLGTSQTVQLTDGMADATDPAFAANSDRLFFLGSTMAGWKRGGGLSADEVPMQRRVYECKLADKISVRPLPAPGRAYERILPGAEQSILLLDHTSGSIFVEPLRFSLYEYEYTSGKTSLLAQDLSDVDSAGGRVLFSRDGRWFIRQLGGSSSSDLPLQLESVSVRVEPKAQWNEMYSEFWRVVRDFFYDPNLHGLNWSAMRERYRPFLAGIVTRDDLNYLFMEMEGELSTSHVKVYGGDRPVQKPVPVGLLGADFALDSGRYRFSKIYAGDPWRQDLRAPLSQGENSAQPGEYLIAIEGRDVRESDNLFEFLQNTVGKRITLRVSKDPTGAGSRDLQVEPIANETYLRQSDWIETNRRRVEESTGGRVAYLYIPDTLESGYDRFNRDFYAQTDKDAAIVDIRFIPGGALPDYFVQRLNQRILCIGVSRESGAAVCPPGIYGPKVMLINEYAGSGGDALAWFFREMGLGQIIGKRTWGGLTGAFNSPDLMDGTKVEIPNVAIFGPSGRLEIENYGVAPDQEVELDAAMVRKGIDPQLEAAISAVKTSLEQTPPRKPISLEYPRFKRP